LTVKELREADKINIAHAQYVSALKILQVPTLIVCGDKDTQIGPVSVQNLRNLANCEVDIIDGGHPCYLDSPDTFHEHLYIFLAHLSS